MKEYNFTFTDNENVEIYVYKWIPDENIKCKGVVQIAHGMAEHAKRYERFAAALTNEGYIVYANDHRGHGKTAGRIENIGCIAEKDGFWWMVENLHQLTGIIKEQNPQLPIFLFGHSMGSFLAQRYIQLYSRDIRGTVLSGSNGKQGFMLNVGMYISKKECEGSGRKEKSEKLNKLVFGSYNKSFKPNRTSFDWLSRDKEEVDKYISDSFCGGVFPSGFFFDFFKGLKEVEKESNLTMVSKELPILIFSGSKDPVGKNGKGVERLANTYKKLGIKDLRFKLYENGRHEMLNEENKEEVTSDVLSWLNSHI